jgi:hypothetical protein
MSENIITVTDDQWSVSDSNAKTEPRTHEPVAGFFYKLTAQSKTPMPRQHAAVFLRDPAFKVFDELGQLQAALPEQLNLRATKGGIVLQEGQTVAIYDDLTTKALFARCVARPGGHEINPKDRAAMVEFLKTAPTVVELPRSQRARDMTSEAETNPDQLPDDVTARMMGAQDALARAGATGQQRDPLEMGA